MNPEKGGIYQIRRLRSEIMAAAIASGEQSSLQDACRAACIEFETDLAKLNKLEKILLQEGRDHTLVNVSRLEGMSCYASVLHNNKDNKVTLGSQCGLYLMSSLSKINRNQDNLVDFKNFESDDFTDGPTNSHFSFRDCEYSGEFFHYVDQHICKL